MSLGSADADWVVTRTGRRLHAAAEPARSRFNAEDWDGEPVIGTTVCGRTSRLMLPGLFDRLGAPRCRHCSRLTGLPAGTGSPRNDPRARMILGLPSSHPFDAYLAASRAKPSDTGYATDTLAL